MEFYSIDDKKCRTPLFVVQEECETPFEKMFAYVQQKTGYEIDMYKRIVCYENHLKAMIDHMNIVLESQPCFIGFRSIVEGILCAEKCIVFLGD